MISSEIPFILDRNLAKANCTGNRVCTSSNIVVLDNRLNSFYREHLLANYNCSKTFFNTTIRYGCTKYSCTDSQAVFHCATAATWRAQLVSSQPSPPPPSSLPSCDIFTQCRLVRLLSNGSAFTDNGLFVAMRRPIAMLMRLPCPSEGLLLPRPTDDN